MEEKSKHKAGFVNILGKPNAGKSTLLNTLLGEKLSIVTEKAQTTRHRIFGIYNDPDTQIVFSDTPGILEPKYGLQEKMMQAVKESFQDADAYLYIADIKETPEIPDWVLNPLKKSGKYTLVILNKMDTATPEMLTEKVDQWHEVLPEAEILPISALFGFNTELILPKLKSILPENPPYYDKDALTDRSMRFFVNEIIREKILKNYQKEIPYAVEVVTEQFKEDDDQINIEATIYAERETQKGILLGHKGMRLKKLQKEASRDIADFYQKNINLNIFIKVSKDWRKNEKDLKRFGYF